MELNFEDDFLDNNNFGESNLCDNDFGESNLGNNNLNNNKDSIKELRDKSISLGEKIKKEKDLHKKLELRLEKEIILLEIHKLEYKKTKETKEKKIQKLKDQINNLDRRETEKEMDDLKINYKDLKKIIEKIKDGEIHVAD